jgi:hypothetical protein
MLDDNLHKTDAECTEILNYIFCDALSLYKKVDHFDISDFKQDELIGINELEEFLYILGLAVYDIFSNNHDVIGYDKKTFDLGSLRGSGHFIADFLNENYNNPSNSYEYMDFYMGTIWIRSRGDLTPFYEFIFLKLKEFHCDWNYFFPLNQIVKAYKNVYGVLPNGHPQKEFE